MKRILLIIPLIVLGAQQLCHAQNVKITNAATSPGQVSDVAYFVADVTPNDSTDLTNPATRGLWVGGAGTVKIDAVGGGTVTFTAVAAGTWLKVAAKRVYSTGTSATLIKEFY